jgi:hypothetical protein
MSQENAFISQFGSSGGGGGAGIQGLQGAQGLQGVQGNLGTQGSTGSGAQGVQGVQGVQGNLGTQGSTGSGAQGTQGVQGERGEIGLQGIQGLQGEIGAQGSTGAGTQGVQGLQGVQGQLGTQGSTGAGIQGVQGVQGLQGEIGAQGSTGAGIQGVQGVQGQIGLQGEIGAQGSTGAGIQGVQGVQGQIGLQGDIGSQGTTGAGIQGVQGVQGVQGLQGDIGSQGTTGAGIQGVQGVQGLIGSQGIQGAGGVVGYFGSFFSTQDQSATTINTETLFTYNNTSYSNGVSVAGTQIRFNNEGYYALNFSIQFENLGGGGNNEVEVWLKLNGNNIANSATRYIVPSNAPFVVSSLDFFLRISVGDYIEVAWDTDNLNIQAHADLASPPYPAIPSVILNTWQVTYAIQGVQGATGSGTQGSQGTQGLQGVQGLQGAQRYNDGNIQLQWSTGFANLTNGVDNPIPFNSASFTRGSDLASSNLGTTNAGVLISATGVYLVTCRSHFFDMGSNMIMTTGLRSSTNGTTWTFLTFNNRARYEGTNTNQIQDSSFLIYVTSVPFYIQMYVNPSANAPFPADLGAPSTLGVSRIGV